MKQFLRLSDGYWPITERDLDPACVTSSPNFRPNGTEYVEPRYCVKPYFDADTQEAVETYPALLNGIWTQQWAVVRLDAPTIAANQVTNQAASSERIWLH